jgi:hypothetical protein
MWGFAGGRPGVSRIYSFSACQPPPPRPAPIGGERHELVRQARKGGDRRRGPRPLGLEIGTGGGEPRLGGGKLSLQRLDVTFEGGNDRTFDRRSTVVLRLALSAFVRCESARARPPAREARSPWRGNAIDSATLRADADDVVNVVSAGAGKNA